ncbi:hypothetical protein HDU87_004354 [Geranomyces variabilis]|uniref:Adhesin domain-containing protein n=1 Tax=Geranomyces variabilis TaxID=109894 RepID=A0AAD5TIQ5_9FUNG|nr:hypothetical protein HDU87_004354 [Geranomyces variabilis]
MLDLFQSVRLIVLSENADIVITEMSNWIGILDAVTIETTNGAIRSAGFNINGAASFTTRTGEIVASGLSVSSLSLRSTNGRITATDISTSASVNAGLVIETENGAASLARVRTTALHVNTAAARASIFLDDVNVSHDTRIHSGGSIHGQIAVERSAALSLNAEQAVLLEIDGAPRTVSASTIVGPLRIAVSDPAFSGSFVARSEVRRVHIIGGDLHFAQNNGETDNVWRGWRKNKNGAQRVSAYAQDGTVDLEFAF